MTNQSHEDAAKAAQRAAADRLKQARIAAGFSSAMGAAKYFQWKTSTYSSHENGSAAIRPFWAELYGQAFRVSPRWILSGIDDPSVMPLKGTKMNSLARSPTTNINPTPRAPNPGFSRVGSATQISVFAWKRIEHNQIVTDFSRVLEGVSTPANLFGVEEAYAALVADNSMSPRVRLGDTIFVNPTKPPRAGDLVIATNGQIGYLREYVGYDNDPYAERPTSVVKDADDTHMHLPVPEWEFHRVVGVFYD